MLYEDLMKSKQRYVQIERGCSSVVAHQTSNPKTVCSVPWWGRVRNSFSVSPESTLVQTYLCLTLYMCTAHTEMCAHIKDPLSICCRRVGHTTSGMVI